MSTLTQVPAATGTIVPSEEFPNKFNRLLLSSITNWPTIPYSAWSASSNSRGTRNAIDRRSYTTTLGDNVRIGQRWSEMGSKPPLEEAMKNIDSAGAWISIHQAQLDPEYAGIFYQCMREFESLTGVDFKKAMRVEDALIFITSPRRVTTYHIDRECNFLMQIRGEKTIYMFDRKDREVLPEEEIERFWTVDNNAPVYKPDLQSRSTPIRLVPGNGVHIPVNDPHWLQNDDNISVSLSVNFTWKDSALANVYRANHFMRRFGLNPTPPGRSALRDTAKKALIAASFIPARDTVRFVRRLRGVKGRTI